MESTCPICLENYPEAWEPSLWLQCSRCFRSVHALCVEKVIYYTQQNIDPVFFMCPDCIPKLKDEKQSLPCRESAGSGDKTSRRNNHEKCKRGVVPTGPRSFRHSKLSSGGSWLKVAGFFPFTWMQRDPGQARNPFNLH